MSDLAKLIAEETSDARHFHLYGFDEWRKAITILLEAGLSATEVEIVMTSNFPQYGSDPLLRKYHNRQIMTIGETLADYVQSIGIRLIMKILND